MKVKLYNISCLTFTNMIYLRLYHLDVLLNGLPLAIMPLRFDHRGHLKVSDSETST